MNIDSLLTLTSLLVAIWALLPRARRLDLILKFRLTDWLFTSFAFICLNYLLFYKTFVLLGWTPGWKLSRWGINPQNASYLFLVSAFSLLIISVKKAPLPRKKIYKIKELCNELLGRKESHSELMSLLEKHLSALVKIYRNDYLTQKIKKNLIPEAKTSAEMIALILEASDEKEKQKSKNTIVAEAATKAGTWLLNNTRPIRNFINSRIPSYGKEVEVAQDLFHSVLSNKSFIQTVIAIKPYFAIEIFELDIADHAKEDFVDYYFRGLLADHSSALYSELKNNQNQLANHRYALPESNKLLFYLFSKINQAYALEVWRPIGEQAISDLDKLYVESDTDIYNLPHDASGWEWESTVYAAIHFFDIMVAEAIEQQMQWHMWLYYYTHFTNRICRNFNPNKRYGSESDTKYAHLLYSIISTLCNWIRKIEDIPIDQSNVVLGSTSLEHENENIIKCSMLAMGQCIKSILITDKIPPDFRKEMAALPISLYYDLKRRDQFAGYAEVLFNSLLSGGIQYGDENEEKHLGILLNAFTEHDNIPHKYEHVNAAINHIALKFIRKYGLSNIRRFVKFDEEDHRIILLASNRHRYKVEMKSMDQEEAPER